MKKDINISIGIPAYNEQANIKSLLVSLLSQVEKGFRITEIIVVSDGSTDGTVGQIRSVGNKIIHLIDAKTRLGKSARIDQILRIFKGDILFLLDADIIITDNNLLSKIVNYSDFKKSGLIGISAGPYKPRGFFQKLMEAGVLVTEEIGKRWNNGRNYLLFKGCFLGLSKDFAKSVKMPKEIVNNDAYLYFAAIEKGLSPAFITGTAVYFKSPQNLSDHLKQSDRFKFSKSEMKMYFKFNLDSEYKIPGSVFATACTNRFFSNPVTFLGYIFINFLSRIKKNNELKSTWNIAFSTKR